MHLSTIQTSPASAVYVVLLIENSQGHHHNGVANKCTQCLRSQIGIGQIITTDDSEYYFNSNSTIKSIISEYIAIALHMMLYLAN